MIYLLNCSNDTHCVFAGQEPPQTIGLIHYSLVLAFSSFGFITNSICISVLIDLNTNFLRFLFYFSLCSLVFCSNELANGIIFFSLDFNFFRIVDTRAIYRLGSYILYYSYIYLPIRQTFITLSNFLDIFIALERIQLYRMPTFAHINFIGFKARLVISLVLSVGINMPMNFNRTPTSRTFNVTNMNTTFEGFSQVDEKKKGSPDEFWLFLGIVIMRDIVTMVLELIVSIALIIVAIRYYKRHRQLMRQANRTRALSQTKIAITLCLVSVVLHVINFLTFVVKIYDPTPEKQYYALVGMINVYLNQLKHLSNLFLFMKINKKFKIEYHKLLVQLKLKTPLADTESTRNE